jgi:TonB family protein
MAVRDCSTAARAPSPQRSPGKRVESNNMDIRALCALSLVAAFGGLSMTGCVTTSSHPESAQLVDRASARPGPDFPLSESYRPAETRTSGEFGRTEVHACVGPDGRLTEAPTIARSSGFPRLDEAALRLATAGSGHYLPATENKQPITQCFVFRVNWPPYPHP